MNGKRPWLFFVHFVAFCSIVRSPLKPFGPRSTWGGSAVTEGKNGQEISRGGFGIRGLHGKSGGWISRVHVWV